MRSNWRHKDPNGGEKLLIHQFSGGAFAKSESGGGLWVVNSKGGKRGGKLCASTVADGCGPQNVASALRSMHGSHGTVPLILYVLCSLTKQVLAFLLGCHLPTELHLLLKNGLFNLS